MATDATTTSAPLADADIFYPASDGKPLAETPKHRDAIYELIIGLQDWFAADPQVYVSGKMFLYFVEGEPRLNVSPDVMVVRGVAKDRNRPTYKTWEEGGKAPDLVVEISSKSSRREDLRTRLALYRDELQVREYFLFDPLGEYLKPRFRGFRLVHGEYQPIPDAEGQMASEVLGLHLRSVDATVRLVDPATGQIIPNRLEALEAALGASQHRAELVRDHEQIIQAQAAAIADRELTIREREMTIRALKLAAGELELARARAELEQERLRLEIVRLQADPTD